MIEIAVVEAGEHVEAGRAARRARGRSGRRRSPRSGSRCSGTKVSFSSCAVSIDADLARAEGGDVERRAVAGHRHARGEGEALRVLGVGEWRAAVRVVDVLVEVARRHRRRAGSSTVIRFSARWPRTASWPAKDARALEALVVARLGVGDVDLPAHRVDGHVEEDGADAGEEAGGAGDAARGGLAVASMTKTSLSGSENFTLSSQVRPTSSTQWLAVELDDQAGRAAAGMPWQLVVRRRRAGRRRA